MANPNLFKESLMRWPFASLLIGLLFLLVPAAPAHACKWDRDTRNSEREFKSQYEDSPGVNSLLPDGAPESSPRTAIPIAVTGIGALLLLGALALTFNRLGRDRV
jgi:hypothetical protein